MTFNADLKKIIGASFIMIASCDAFSEEPKRNAPTATLEEAQIIHWSNPEIERSFTDIPELEFAFIDTSPVNMNDKLIVGTIDLNSKKKDIIVNLSKQISEGKYGNIDSFLISHKGKLVFESYYRRGRVDLSHPQSSATKSYTSLALGRAIQMGYLSMADLDKPVISFLQDLDLSKLVDGAEKITLHNALTMTTGIQIDEATLQRFDKNPSKMKGQGEIQAILEHGDSITKKAQVFRYGMGPQFVMQVIDAVVPGSAKDFIEDELLGKLGITNYDWQTAASGLPESGWKVSIRSRDMLKLGALAMNNGRWEDEQLISEAFIKKATSRIITTGDDRIFGGGKDVSNQGYGYYWWNADLKSGDKSYFSSSAQGGGGMFIVLVKELELMLVVTAHDRENTTLQIMADTIIPAFFKRSNNS